MFYGQFFHPLHPFPFIRVDDVVVARCSFFPRGTAAVDGDDDAMAMSVEGGRILLSRVITAFPCLLLSQHFCVFLLFFRDGNFVLSSIAELLPVRRLQFQLIVGRSQVIIVSSARFGCVLMIVEVGIILAALLTY